MNLPNINKRKIINLLKEERRMDGRRPFEFREIILEKNISKNAEGSVRIKIGKTDVIVGIKLDVMEPYKDKEDEGTLITSMEFSSSAGERYETGPPQMDSIEIARVVDRGIRESGFIDWKKLCIKEKEKVWCVMIDIYCLNDDGNVLDASALGALAALKLTRFPKYNEEEGVVEYGNLTDEFLPLTDKIPFTMTFYKLGDKFILDPTREEEDSANSRLTITLSAGKKEKIINAIQKGGISPITIKEFEKIIEQAEKTYDNFFPLIEKKIEKLKIS